MLLTKRLAFPRGIAMNCLSDDEEFVLVVRKKLLLERGSEHTTIGKDRK